MGEALATIAGGLGQGLVQAQELGMKRDYYAALKKQADADIKVAEMKAQRELQRSDMLSKFLGGKPPSMPMAGAGQQQSFVQPAPHVGGDFVQPAPHFPDGRMDIALGPNPTDADILSAYNKVQAAPPPQQGIPQQLAQAQMPNLTAGQGRRGPTTEELIAFRELMGYDYPIAADKVTIEKVSDETGTLLIPYDAWGNQVGPERRIPKNTKFTVQDTEGGEWEGYGPPPNIRKTKPSPLDVKALPPEKEREKLFTMQTQMAELYDLGAIAMQRPDVVGLAGQLEFGVAENKFGAWFLNKFGYEPDPVVTEFYKRYNKLQTMAVHDLAGTAVQARELQRALATLPQASTAQQFITGLKAIDTAYKSYEKAFYDFYSKSPREREGGAGENKKKPSLKVGEPPTPGPTNKPKTAEEYFKQRGM